MRLVVSCDPLARGSHETCSPFEQSGGVRRVDKDDSISSHISSDDSKAATMAQLLSGENGEGEEEEDEEADAAMVRIRCAG